MIKCPLHQNVQLRKIPSVVMHSQGLHCVKKNVRKIQIIKYVKMCVRRIPVFYGVTMNVSKLLKTPFAVILYQWVNFVEWNV